ncbi:MAG: hypothetical protein PHD43_01100 [Methylococcales bacterium]|nr:hypothetical protein [Methylococcales bacterium]
MFSKISRYRKLPNVVTVDAQGRRLESKSLRLLPEVTGIFLHTVESGDRLDHLAYKYYKQPRKWWRICDANPAFPSPQALLGKEPIVTTSFPLTFAGGSQPPWAELLKQLERKLGVEGVKVVDEIRLVAQEQTIGGQTIKVNVERHDLAVTVTYNRMNISISDLADVMAAVGFGVTQPENIGRVGKKIIIPPDVIG